MNKMDPGQIQPSFPIELFFSYSHKDEDLRENLEKHLDSMRRQGKIQSWHDRKITAGTEWRGEIDKHLDTAHIILLLVSADFLASDYCYDIELKRALERDGRGDARVIPIILRPVDWQDAPFKSLQALPKDGKPVTTWANKDEAFEDISKGIRRAIADLANMKTIPLGSHNWHFSLPRRHSNFIGREGELSKICQSLEAGQIVQIRGLGGIGKSALAIEGAYRMLSSFPDGIKWFFAPDYETIELFLNELAGLFGIKTGQMSLEDKIAFLQGKLGGKKALVILDNVENIELAVEIIRIIPHFPVIITSRPHIPMLKNIHWINLDVLSLEEAIELFVKISGIQSNKLEEESYFQQIKKICKALGYFPLAIELAAKLYRFAKFDLSMLHQEIIEKSSSEIFDNIPEFIDDRSVGASFLSTYQFLDDREKQLFDLLGVFPARTFSLPAIKAIAKDFIDEELVQSIIHKKLIALSLVNFDHQRYNLHPLLKSFAASHLDAFEPYKRMAEYFTSFAQTNKREFSALEEERANLLGVMDWCYDSQEYQLAFIMAEALVGELRYFSFLSLKGYWYEAIKRLKQELNLMQLLSKAETGRIQLNLGYFHYLLGNHQEARNAHKLAEEEFKKNDDFQRLIITYWQSGYIEDDEDNYNKATEYYEESLRIAEKHEPRLILNSRKLVAVVQYHLGNYERAKVDMEQSLQEAIGYNDKPDIGTCQRRLAAVYRRLAQNSESEEEKNALLSKSRELLFDCLEIEQNERSIARAYRQLGMVEQEANEIHKANNYYERSLKMSRNLGNKKGIAATLYNLGTISESQGSLDKAEAFYKESLEVGKTLTLKFGVALNKRQLGKIAHLRGYDKLAFEQVSEAITILTQINSPFLQETKEMFKSIRGLGS